MSLWRFGVLAFWRFGVLAFWRFGVYTIEIGKRNILVNITAIILAAGQGTRMHSSLPKVLHHLAKKPLLQYVIDAVINIPVKQTIVVCGYQAELVKKAFAHIPIDWVIQQKQLGTGDAVRCALPRITNTEQILVLCGDVPLIATQTLQCLINNTPPGAVGILTAVVDQPTGLGRIIRNEQGEIIAIVEEQDTTQQQKTINEINAGVYLLPTDKLSNWLTQISTNNAQNEMYLTDIVKLAKKDNVAVYTEQVQQEQEIMGVNTKGQLAVLERYYQHRLAEDFMSQGVTIIDPQRLDIRGNVTIGKEVTLDINVILEGDVTIADNVVIGANVFIKDSNIGAGTEILANSIIDMAKVGNNCQIGPFARVRPTTVLQDKVKLGNFVEVKNSTIGIGSKANHLSYLGDADIGGNVNVGAGVITCNYDGANKHKTVVEAHASIGADVQLIAPVKIGNGATIAAGTTVMKDVAQGGLVLNTKQQRHIKDWQRPQKLVTEKIIEE